MEMIVEAVMKFVILSVLIGAAVSFVAAFFFLIFLIGREAYDEFIA